MDHSGEQNLIEFVDEFEHMLSQKNLHQLLSCACVWGYIMLAKKLVGLGAIKDEYSRTRYPVSDAVSSGNRELVRFLVGSGMSVDYEITPPLDVAISHKDYSMIELLIELGVDPNPGGYSDLLFYGLIDASYDPLLRLILDHGADPNLPDSRDRYILTELVRLGKLDRIRHWIRRGTQVTSQAINLAMETQQKEIAEYLIRTATRTDPKISLLISQTTNYSTTE